MAIPNLSVSSSASSSASSANDAVFGNQIQTGQNGGYVPKPQNAIVGGGTGINISTPINFGESLSATLRSKQEGQGEISQQPETVTQNWYLFAGMAVVGVIFAFLIRR